MIRRLGATMADNANIPQKCAVAIVGGGTSGLALATELKHLGVRDVVILERENTAGGVPRHCGHYGFGIREFKRVMTGPDYARTLVQKAKAAGVAIYTDTTVTALHPGGALSLTTPDGNADIQAERVILCTGVRESSRAQRFIGGQRPQGVVSTGALQSMVYLHGKRPFRRPVILGSELVSFSAIMTCRHLGIKPVAMIEENNRVIVRQFMRPYPMMMGVPMVFNASNVRVIGERQVKGIEYLDVTGERQNIATDGVIISGRFRPESALLRLSHLDVDPNSGGPEIDQYGRASDPAYFCTGNLLRPVETSSWCWHEAVETANRVARDLKEPIGADRASVPLLAAHPAIKFAVPQRLTNSITEGAMTEIQIRLQRPVNGTLTATSGGKTLWSKHINSRPERRILTPLPKSNLGEPIELTLKEKG